MDDSTQSGQAQSTNNVITQPAVGVVQPVSVAQPTVTPVSTVTVGKEVERPVSDFVSNSETQPILDREVSEIGVEVVSEKPKLTEEHEEIGVKHSLENNVPKLDPSGSVNLPFTDTQISEIEKESNTQSSAFWLALLIKKIKKTIFFRK